MRLLDDLEGRRIVKAGAVLPADHHMERIGAGQLVSMRPGRGDRLFTVRNLIGEPVARLELQVQRGEVAEKGEPDERIEDRMLDDAIDDGADEVAERVHHAVGRACGRAPASSRCG